MRECSTTQSRALRRERAIYIWVGYIFCGSLALMGTGMIALPAVAAFTVHPNNLNNLFFGVFAWPAGVTCFVIAISIFFDAEHRRLFCFPWEDERELFKT